MKHKLVFLACSILLILGVGTTALAQEAEEWVCPEGFEGQTLNFFNWATYIAEDTIPNFEEACGVTVVSSFFGSNEELLQILRIGNPGYDLIVPSDYGVSVLAAEGLLEPLDKSVIPNIENVTPSLTGLAFDPENAYSIPYQWGTVGLGYDVNAVAEVLGEDAEITSWEVLFTYPERRIAWLDDPRIMIGIALDYLGYDVNTTNLDELEEAKNLLIEAGQLNVVAIAADNGQELLATDQVDLAVEYMGDIYQIADACAADAEACGTEYAYAIPAEGTNVWIDNMAIPVGAPNKPLAEVFINYILDTQVGADISNYTAYASPNQAAIDAGLIDEIYLDSPIIYPTAESMENLWSLVGFTDTPDVEQAYNDAWTDIKLEIGM
jgi:spermidine/putrescine transport system substrate-binding protein